MSVIRLNSVQLSSFLANKGLSDVGQKSITDCEITGEMLLEFCEEDIQDAFSVFKDRFIIRKVLREQKSVDSSNLPFAGPVVFPPRKSSPERNFTHQRRPVSPEPYTQRMSPQYTATRSGLPSPPFTVSQNSISPGNQSNMHPQSHENRQSRGVISLVNTEPETVVPVQIHPNISNSYPPTSPTTSRSVVSRRHSSELMNARVSSTDETKVLKHKIEKVDESSANVYDSAIDALVSLSNKHTGSSETNTSKTPDSQGLNLCVEKSGTSSLPSNFKERQSTSSDTCLPSASSIYGLNYDCTYAWNVMSNKVKAFTTEELLSKRNRFGKPSEGQRLGGILIRNAAHAAGLWNDAPCLHEISLPQKKDFFKFIVSVAPQLANSQNVLFIRLREALQNRRKYLLDKKLGKVQARRRRGPSDVGMEIADSGSFIDLSDISDEVDMNSDEIFVKTEAMIKKE